MPVIRIDLPEGTPRATTAAVRGGVKAAAPLPTALLARGGTVPTAAPGRK